MCKKLSLKNASILILMLMMANCTVHSPYNYSYVSDSISRRTGQGLGATKNGNVFELPDHVSLEDGLSENEAVAIALWNNAQFRADLVELGFARADLIDAGLLRNPVLSLLFPLGPKQLEATLNLPIDFFWRRPKRIAAAKLNLEHAADNLVQHGLNLIRDVIIAYSEVLFTGERAKIVEEEAALQSEIAAIAVVRLKAGDISQLEETAFRLEADGKKEMRIRFTRDAKLAEERLKMLMGLGLRKVTLHLSPTTNTNKITQSSSDLLTSAFAARPDLRAAEIAIEAAGKRLGWERAEIFKLTAVLDANAEGKEGFEMGPGVQVELPILNRNNGNITRAKAGLEQTIKRYMAVKHHIALEVLEAYTNYHAAQKALEILQSDIVTAAETAAKNAWEAYLLGEISYLEFLDFKRQFLNSRLREVEAEADLRRAEANLKHSIGFKPLVEKKKSQSPGIGDIQKR